MTNRTTNTEPGDWVEWHGGECPVVEGTKVKVKLRSGEINSDRATWYDWKHHHPDHRLYCEDIVAYRVVSRAHVPGSTDAELLAEARGREQAIAELRAMRDIHTDGSDAYGAMNDAVVQIERGQTIRAMGEQDK